MALNSLYGMVGKAPKPTVDDGMGGNMAPNQMPDQSPTQTTGDPKDLMQMLQPFLDKAGTAGQGQRNQADQYRQQSRDASQAAYDIKAPNSTAPAFRTADAIGLGLLALVSGRHFDKALMGYMGAKNQKAEAETQAALQSFGMRQKSMLSQAQNFAGMADDADRRAAQEQDQAQRQFGTMATALVSRINNQNTNDTGLKKTNIGADAGIKKAEIGADAKVKTATIKTEADIARDKANMFGTMAKMTPEGRATWAKANGYNDEQSAAMGSMSPAELLAAARATKIPYEIKALQSNINVSDARAKQIVEATRFIGPSFKLKQDQLALNIQNVESLIEMRKAGIDLTKIRGDMLQKGVSSMNQAIRSSTYLLKTAQDEIRKIYETSGGNFSDSQKARLEELTGAVKKNQGIIDELNMAQGFLAPVDPSQLFGGVLGDVPPMPVGAAGLTAGAPPRTGAIGGGVTQTRPATQSQRSGGKGKGGTAPKVDPKRPGLRITNINGSVPGGN